VMQVAKYRAATSQYVVGAPLLDEVLTVRAGYIGGCEHSGSAPDQGRHWQHWRQMSQGSQFDRATRWCIRSVVGLVDNTSPALGHVRVAMAHAENPPRPVDRRSAMCAVDLDG